MRFFFILIFCCVLNRSNAQDPLNIGMRDSLYSKILGENRQLWISVPPGANTNKYPVAFLLDAEEHFHLFTAICGHVGELGNSLAPDMVVVGILNTDRTRDLTPQRDSAFPFPSGGAENFTAFLEKELIPFIESKYPVRPYRILAGHSFGGLFVMNTLLHHSQLFQSYLCIDPAMHWNGSQLLKETPELLRKTDLSEKRLFLAIARPFPDLDSAQARADHSNSTLGFRTVVELNEKLAAGKLQYSSRYYPSEYHSHLPLPAYYDGLKAVYSFYKRPILSVLDSSSAEKLIRHYKNISEKMGYNILPREDLIGGYCWRFQMENRLEEGISFLDELKLAYPEFPLLYEQLAEMHSRLGREKQAAQYRDHALKLRETNVD